jgi:hypothetical protein
VNEDNGIPVVNFDLGSKDPILFHSPPAGYDPDLERFALAPKLLIKTAFVLLTFLLFSNTDF